MNINISPISAVITLAISLLTLWGIIVKPFKDSINKNAEVMSALDKTVSRLQNDLDESKRDRAGLHSSLEKLDSKVEQNCLDIAKHDERINTLFKRAN